MSMLETSCLQKQNGELERRPPGLFSNRELISRAAAPTGEPDETKYTGVLQPARRRRRLDLPGRGTRPAGPCN
jgi:hypothetical protein